MISDKNRAEIVCNLKTVAACKIVETLDKVVLLKRFKFNAIFIGDDWKGSERWNKTKRDLAVLGVDVIYIPHTADISSTLLRVEVPNRVE